MFDLRCLRRLRRIHVHDMVSNIEAVVVSFIMMSDEFLNAG